MNRHHNDVVLQGAAMSRLMGMHLPGVHQNSKTSRAVAGTQPTAVAETVETWDRLGTNFLKADDIRVRMME